MSRKKVAIIGRAVDESQVDQPSLFYEYLHKLPGKIDYSAIEYKDIYFDLDNKSTTIRVDDGGVSLSSFDAVLAIGWFNRLRPYEDTVHALAYFLMFHNIPFFNREMLHRSKGKLSQYTIFSLNKLTIPPTIFHHNVDYVTSAAYRKFGFPFILKTTNGSRGSNNYLIQNQKQFDLVVTEAKASGRVYCAQEYIENDGDYRILVMNKKVRYAIYRQANKDTHLNNTSAGGKATIVNPGELSKEIIEMALKAADLLGRDIAGVDIMLSKANNKPYILEVNNMPQLATGAYPEIKMKALQEMFEELL